MGAKRVPHRRTVGWSACSTGAVRVPIDIKSTTRLRAARGARMGWENRDEGGACDVDDWFLPVVVRCARGPAAPRLARVQYFPSCSRCWVQLALEARPGGSSQRCPALRFSALGRVRPAASAPRDLAALQHVAFNLLGSPTLASGVEGRQVPLRRRPLLTKVSEQRLRGRRHDCQGGEIKKAHRHRGVLPPIVHPGCAGPGESRRSRWGGALRVVHRCPPCGACRFPGLFSPVPRVPGGGDVFCVPMGTPESR